jgi:hypothetical protein
MAFFLHVKFGIPTDSAILNADSDTPDFLHAK